MPNDATHARVPTAPNPAFEKAPMATQAHRFPAARRALAAVCLIACSTGGAFAGQSETGRSETGQAETQDSGHATMSAPSNAAAWTILENHTQTAGPLARSAAAFLARHRPPRDASIDPAILIDAVDLSVRAHAEFPWASSVPEEIYLNSVVPYAVLDETRENWRPAMLERCRPIVEACTTATEAAQALNRELFNLVNVHYNTGRKKPNQSPAESMEQGIATCTGLSILLVDACRSVGVPARVAGVANWHNKRGNHTWVEIWDNGWHFLGADEYDAKGVNRGWFVGDARKAVAGSEEHAVWATSFKPTGHHFPMVWDRSDTSVHAVDATGRYAPEADVKSRMADVSKQTVYFRVFESRGGNRLNAHVFLPAFRGDKFSVLTKAGTTDLNDMPSAVVPRGEAITLTISVGGDGRFAYAPPSDAESRTVDLYWNELTRNQQEAPLSAKAAESSVLDSFRRRMIEIAVERQPELVANAFTLADHTLKILEKTFGDEPDSGRSLWISMHGGGGAPAEVNDQQWQNQIKLYQPEEGIYIAPRAPTDTWNLWHQAHIDGLFDRLIETYIATRNVNPDKVYLMGYSAGGDGVYQLAPRMADRFAAAAMMAGHPNETKPLGLRNLPFALLMGGDDAAYDRNAIAHQWKEKLAALREADPGGYPHEVKIYEGMGHWMQRKDAEILPWMASHTRNPWPTKIVWHQDDVTHDRFYWLALEPNADGSSPATPRTTIEATVEAQTIRLTTPDHLTSIRIRLRDELIDLDEAVTVVVNGEQVFEGVVPRTQAAIDRSLQERLDPRSAATAELVVRWTRAATPASSTAASPGIQTPSDP